MRLKCKNKKKLNNHIITSYCYVFFLGFCSQYGIDYLFNKLSQKVLNILVELFVHFLTLTRQHLYSLQ